MGYHALRLSHFPGRPPDLMTVTDTMTVAILLSEQLSDLMERSGSQPQCRVHVFDSGLNDAWNEPSRTVEGLSNRSEWHPI